MCQLAQDTVGDILARGRIFEVGGAVRDAARSIIHVEDADEICVPYRRRRIRARRYRRRNRCRC